MTVQITEGPSLTMSLEHVLDFVLSVELMLRSSDNSSFTVVLQNREKKERWSLHYSCNAPLIYSKVYSDE